MNASTRILHTIEELEKLAHAFEVLHNDPMAKSVRVMIEELRMALEDIPQ